jgi:16S rRNA (uracil1498-N3)-methyltransferase
MYETGEREALDAVLGGNRVVGSAAIITGPEGGFAEFEAKLAKIAGLHVCSMGERILRCETAPVVAVTALMYATGKLS